MSEVREVLKFEVEAVPKEQRFLIAIISIFAAVITDALLNRGRSDHNLLIFLGNSGTALLSGACFGLLTFYFSQIRGYCSLEVSQKSILICKSLVLNSNVPIAHISTVWLDELDDEDGSVYVGWIVFKGRKLRSVPLDRFECIRLRTFFRYLKSLNPEMEFRQTVNYLAMRPFQ